MTKLRQFDFIKENTDIFDYISQRVKLKKMGSEYKGICPFHNEKTPSFTVYKDKKSFYCFGCGKGGTIIDFVIHEQGFNNAHEALNYIKEEFGYEFENDEEMAVSYIKNKILEFRNKDLDLLNRDEVNLTISCICRNYLKIIKLNETINSYYAREVRYVERILKYVDKILDTKTDKEINILTNEIMNRLVKRKNKLLIG